MICVKNKVGMYKLRKSTKTLKVPDLNIIDGRKAFHRLLLLRKTNNQMNKDKGRLKFSKQSDLRDLTGLISLLLQYNKYILKRNKKYYQKQTEIKFYNLIK